ncbi:hypothetical protein SAMN02745729_10615 [Marinobacterium iners DSM 11526]|uniref:Uncharacterized protein n=1 Tax=Marinobacterium iners DSM 11526 TaxID=1122198 RepID=A0A1H4D9J4_9GAMM|nr:hypothetical protein SAMN02745729_10615 [Marinobacterium iners DSM 11526]
MVQVVFDKAGDEEVAMVVTRLQAQLQRVPRRRTGCFQCFRLELFLQEIIRLALIHQNRQPFFRGCDQFTAVPGFPCFAISAQIA